MYIRIIILKIVFYRKRYYECYIYSFSTSSSPFPIVSSSSLVYAYSSNINKVKITILPNVCQLLLHIRRLLSLIKWLLKTTSMNAIKTDIIHKKPTQ